MSPREMSPLEAARWCRQCCDPTALVDDHGVLNTVCHHIRLPLDQRSQQKRKRA